MHSPVHHARTAQGHLARVGPARCAAVRATVYGNKAMASRANLERGVASWVEEQLGGVVRAACGVWRCWAQREGWRVEVPGAGADPCRWCDGGDGREAGHGRTAGSELMVLDCLSYCPSFG